MRLSTSKKHSRLGFTDGATDAIEFKQHSHHEARYVAAIPADPPGAPRQKFTKKLSISSRGAGIAGYVATG